MLTVPEDLRAKLRDLKGGQLLVTCAGFRVRADDDSLAAIMRLSMRELAQRVQFLDTATRQVLARLRRIATDTAPELMAKHGVARTPPPPC